MASKNEKISKSMEGNTNAEKWTLKEAILFFDKAIKNASDKERDDNDFIGEVAQSLGYTIWTFDYLTNKFPELKKKYEEVKRNCEANCFANGKKQKIAPSMAIMNLKSNHGWTDRVDNTSKDEKIQTTPVISFFKSDDE